MKKVTKSATLAVALVSCASIALPAFSVATIFADEPVQYSIASASTVDQYLQVENFVSTGNIGTEYTLATAVAKSMADPLADMSAFETKVEVTNPFGEIVTTTGDKFTPTVAGTYKVVYSLLDSNGAVVTTSEFELNVAGVSTEYTISAPINSANIIPATVPTKDKNDEATQVKLPNVSEIVVKDADGKAVENLADLGLTVAFEGVTANNGVTPTVTPATETTPAIVTVDKTKDVNVTYTALYSLKKGDVKLANLKMSFVAKPDYSVPAYTFDWVGSKPTTAEIGVETKLPSVQAKSENGKENVAIHYTVKITHTDSITKKSIKYTETGYTKEGESQETPYGDKKLIDVKDGGFVFIPNDTGNYVVEYTIKDFNGNAPKTSTTKFSIDNVTQTKAPTPKVALPYTTEGDGIDALEGFNEVQDNKNIMILPIDADDNANGYVENNLTLYRQIWDASISGNEGLIYDEKDDASANPKKALIFNKDNFQTKTVFVNGIGFDIEEEGDTTEAKDKDGEAVTLNEGSYIVKYFAKNKLSGKDEVVLSVPLKIVADFASVAKPTVTFDALTTLPSSANLGDKITFKAPTATQKADEDYTHTNLSTYIKYDLCINGVWQEESQRYDEADNSWITLNEDKTEYTLKIAEDATDVTAIKVFACAMNDLGHENDPVSQEIKIIGTGDTALTTIESVVESDSLKKQGQKVILPSVTYNDDLPQYLNVKIVIDGDEEVYNGAYNIAANNDVTYAGAYFTPEEARDYTVSYISTDAGRNKTILTFSMAIAPDPSTYNAEFNVLPSTINGGNAEVGDRISIPSVNVSLSDETNLVAEDWYVTIQGPADVETDHKTFAKFNKVGEYTLQYVCNVHDDDEFNKDITSEKYTIKVTDTQGPKVLNKVAIEDSFNDITKNGSLEKGKYTIKFVKVLPETPEENTVYALIPQASDVVFKDSTLSIVSSGITHKTIKLNDTEALDKGWALTRDDVYQFTYTLKDANGNTTTLDAYTVDVGDVEAPEITVKDGAVASNYTVETSVNVDFSKITVTDMVSGEIKDVITKSSDGKYALAEGYSMTITAVGTNDSKSLTINSSSSSDNRKNLGSFFKFNDLKADEYTLKVSVTDPSTKVGTNTDVTFKVSAENPSAITGEDVLGVVLIVVAVVALGGVVTYFVVTRKKYKNKF